MLADGDMIGDHTWSHIVVAAGGPVAAEQIDRTAVAIRDATHGFTPCLFRAPGRRRELRPDRGGTLDGVHDDPVGHRSA